jgi:LPS-assembly lipoprotein
MYLARKSLFIVLSACLLVSCGFHLRGPVELSAEITPIFMDQSGADNALLRELRSLLSESGKNNLTRSRSEAKAILTIISASKKRRVVAVDERGRARQYELSYLVRYRVTGKNIPQVGNDNAKVLHLKRDVVFDPDSVLAIGHEAENLYEDMRKDGARLILQRLRALSEQKKGEQLQE